MAGGQVNKARREQEDVCHQGLRTQHSLSQAPQLQVGVLEGILQLLVQRLLLAVEQDGAAAVQDSLWSTFHHQQVSGLRRVGVLVNGQLERGCHR